MKKGQLIAFYSGGYWADASCNHFKVIKEVDLKAEKALYEKWYQEIYCPTLHINSYMSFTDWLLKKGYVEKTTESEIEEINEEDL